MIATNPHVLIVEDYDLLREQLVDYLKGRGCLVEGVDCGEELDLAFKKQIPDILILDLNLPGEDGLSIAKRVRARSPATGIVMLTARVRSPEKIEGYQAGADIYITKPAKPEEIFLAVANLASRLRGGGHVGGGEKESAYWTLVTKGCELVAPDGANIPLTMNEYLVMEALVLAPEGRVTSDFLQEKLGRLKEDVSKNQLEALMSRLRKKLSEVPLQQGQPSIKAVWGSGYQLTIRCHIK